MPLNAAASGLPAACRGAMGRAPSWLLAGGFLLAAFLLLAAPYLNLIGRFGFWDVARNFFDDALYSRVVIFGNYFQHGFVRRGLGGTLSHLASEQPVVRLLFFTGFSATFLILPLALLVRRLARSAPAVTAFYLVMVLVASPQTWLGWSQDLARTDMLAAGFVAWAMLAVLSARRWLAASLILCGLLAHETAYIFGAPLLLATFCEDHHDGSLPARTGFGLLAGLVLGAATIFGLQLLLSPPPASMAAAMIDGFPVPPGDDVARIWRDLAIYMAVGNAHAIGTAMCHNFVLDPKYPITAAFCLAVLTAYAFILPLRGKPLLVALAMWLPVVFMLVVANDTGRWLKLGVLNAWLVTVFLVLRAPGGGRVMEARGMILGALLLGALLAMGHSSYNDVSPATRDLTAALGLRSGITLLQWLDTCDPTWRSIVYGA